MATPQLQQYYITTGNPGGIGDSGRAPIFTLPNAVGAANCLVLTITYPVAATTASVTDNNGNTWPSPTITESGGTGNYKMSVFVLPNANAGFTTITVAFGATNRVPFFLRCFEWNNIATTSPVDVSVGAANQSGTSLSTGSMTTLSAGDLIMAFYDLSASAGGNPTSWTPGASFTLLDADICWVSDQGLPKASQYQVQSSAGPINSSISIAGDSGDTFNCVAIALKTTSAGTAYGSGIRLLGSIICSNNTSPTATWAIQASMSGNLRVFGTTLSQANWDITSVTDSESNTWTAEVPKNDCCQCYFLENASANHNLTITVHFTGTIGVGAPNCRIFDVANAATSGQPGAVAANDQTSASSVTSVANQPDITPTSTSSLIFYWLNDGNGPVTALTSPSSAIFDNCKYTGETDAGFINFGDGHGHLNNTSLSAQNVTWSITSVSGNEVAGMAIEFLPAPAGGSTPTYFEGLDNSQFVLSPRYLPQARASLQWGDQGTQSPLVLFLLNDWDTHPFQPPHRAPEYKGAAIFRGDDGTQAPFILFRPNDWDTHPPQPPARPVPAGRNASIMAGDQGTQAQFVSFQANDWDTHPFQPPHPRWEKAGAIMPWESGIEAKFVAPPPTVTWGWECQQPLLLPRYLPNGRFVLGNGDQGIEAPFIPFQPYGWEVPWPQPPHRHFVDLEFGDQGTEALFITFQPYGWEIAPPQPPHPRPERAGAIMPSEPGIEAKFVFAPTTPITWGWEVAPPLLLPKHQPNARGIVPEGGDQGIQAPFVQFSPYGWEIAAPHLPRTISRYAALEGASDFDTFPFQPYGWELPPFQPPHPRPERNAAWMVGDQGIQAPFVFVPSTTIIWGWDVQPFQPPHPRWERAGAIMPPEPGIEGLFVFVPPAATPIWGWDVATPQLRQRINRYAALEGASDFDTFPFQPYGWELPPFQPPHPRPERAASWLTGDQGTEAQFNFVPPPVIIWGWEVAPPFLRRTQANRYPAIEGRSDFAGFTFQPYGWEIAPFQPPHPRAERSGAIPTGDQGTQAPFVFVAPPFTILGWDIPPFQPPHPRPERAAAWMVGHQGTDAPIIFKPYGWEVPPFQPPHPVPERRAAAIMRGDDGIQARFIIPFQEGWHIPPFQPPHPRPERAGSIMVGHQGIDAIFVFVPPPTPTATDWIDFYRRARRR